MTATAPARRGGPVRAMVWASVGMLCLLLVAFGWLTTRVLVAGTGLAQAAAAVRSLPAAVEARDLSALESALASVQGDAHRAAQAAADPVWGVAEALPLLGGDVAALATVARHTTAVADAVAPLPGVAATFGTGGQDTVVDLDALAAAHEPLLRAASVLNAAAVELALIDVDALLPPVAAGVAALRDAVAVGAPAAAGIADATAVLPGILGAEEPRTVLVVIQNNAELRTGGGITGSFALLSADAGRVTLLEQADSGEFPHLTAPLLPVPDATTHLHGDVVARFVQNASMTADFELTAELASAWWQERGGAAPDAVLSIDPLVVRALLAVTGPAVLGDGTELTADNLVQRLLVDPYVALDSVGQTAFLQSATQALFQRLATGGIDPVAWAQALSTPLAQGRVSLWSAHPDEQAVLVGTALAGPGARHAAAGEDAFAVYFNDATGGKMGTFLHVDIATGAAVCRSDGRAEVSVLLTMGSTAPADADPMLPISLTGGGLWGTAWGDIGTNVSVAAPPGWFVDEVRKNGEPEPAVDAVDDGFPTSLARVNLSPAEVNTLEFRFIAPEPGPVAPHLLHTPLLNDPSLTTGADVACR
ncbi:MULTISPECIES: DUF4012 domain-containing protein [unclassified Microbacterium]|uniref:DUF4012 domain-containing protein n=1 Tax=unclassified Microbacterium TaxID=2609290 RepID=UPI00214CB070|nr:MULTISPECIES: DUF4012 domain-containing protein [unclassified Microbacterium]MCR2785601.1 DUF4012 domain-containing protein [Microbacterium sp. zg.B96]WIM17414.1 DUF4012 domain-containing protein [Microbacterium sp. zg-B96]